ncbi:hypothetical protein [Actinomadura rudentiformis]|uniref:Uncharacterized protein n=1 Tax=Actinomadura rudentiformis TaxID=359158 RepID=A0A6H9YU87_9ACTN|nr:hypothetical protein [Actinomadura rudentiformis]KAB2344858.1 hypothetical protein F8566_30160 [Actinomadura rudentiformis]
MSAATVIIAYGYNLGDVRTLGLPWVSDPYSFGEHAAARVHGAHDRPSSSRVVLMPHGFEHEPYWLLVTERSTATAGTVLKLTDPNQFRARPTDDAALEAALTVLGLRAERPPSWLACTYQ